MLGVKKKEVCKNNTNTSISTTRIMLDEGRSVNTIR